MVSRFYDHYVENQENQIVALALASNPAIYDEVIDLLSDTTNIEVLKALVSNPIVSDEKLIEEINANILDLELNDAAELQHLENMENGLA